MLEERNLDGEVLTHLFNDYRFYGANAFVGTGIGNWDVSKVNTFYYTFYHADLFNGDLSNWDVTSATDCMGMVSCAGEACGQCIVTNEC